MNSSGIKRGLAVSAISALAVTGLPFFATSASAIPIEDTLAANDIEFYAPLADVSDKNDGTNTTISLVTGGGANVTSVQYQYQDSAAADPTAWADVPGGIVARNADGVFAYDWSGAPATVTNIRAVANTGDIVVSGAAKLAPAAAETVELATEGNLGVFQEPYTDGGTYDATTSELLAVEGTVSEGTAAVTVTDASHSTGATAAGTIDPESTPASPASDTFNAVLDIDGYTYSAGTEPNQIALNAATANTDDAEGSTLYIQQIGSIEVTPATQEDVTPADAEVDITVLDTQGQPVAGAEVFSGGDTDSDAGGPDTDTDGAETLVGYTDGHGQINNVVRGSAGVEVYYVNTTDNNAYQPGTDPSDSADITTYTPVLTSVDIVNNHNRSNFDIDELSDGDDFTIVTQDQRGNAFEENLSAGDVQYRWIIDPSGAGATYTSDWTDAETVNGEFDVPALTDTSYNGGPVPEGTYTLEARRPNEGGTGLTNATPETFAASESEITFDEGASVNGPIEGETSVTGTLANDGGALAGREVTVTYTPGIDSRIAPQAEQPAGVTVVGNTATTTTDANGQFTIKLEDPAGPVVIDDVPEEGATAGDLNALATGETASDGTDLQGNLGPDDGTGTAGDPHGDADATNDDRDAEADLTVNWIPAPEIIGLDVDVQVLDDYSWFGGNTAAPGSPVDLDITAFTNDGPDGGTDPDVVQDFDVEVSVDKGFLSPNAEDEDELQLDESDTSGLWGFFEDLGSEETVSTGDSGEAGIVAAIEDDADFDDDGLTTMTITVTAGEQTEEVEVQFDARNFLQLVEGDLSPSDGEPSGEVPTTEEVDFDLFVEDQYGNLVGDHLARISDDSTVADFRTDEDFDQTLTDFTTSGPGITAFSEEPTTQTLMAQLSNQRVEVDDADGDADAEISNNPMMLQSEPIVWVQEQEPKINAALTLRGKDNGAADDNLFANAHRKTEGATVTLFRKKKNGEWKQIAQATMNGKGNHRFKNVNDKNGKKKTRYKAVVEATDLTRKGNGKRTVR